MHGRPFFCEDAGIARTTENGLCIRFLGWSSDADFVYDPAVDSFPSVIERIRKHWSPDLVLFWAPEMYPPPFDVEMSELPTAALVSDWNVYYPVLAKNAARYDTVISDKRGAEILTNALWHADYVCPLYAHNPRIHKPYGIPKDIDLVFVGNLNFAAHPVRAQFLERMARLSQRYRVAITSGVYGEDYGRLLSRAQLVFNYSLRGELNLRVFETIACGAVPMLEESNQEAWDWFTPNREIVAYDEHDFEQQIESALGDPQRLQKMAAEGRERLADLAVERRLALFVDHIWQKSLGERRFRGLAEHEKKYETARMYVHSTTPFHRAAGELMVAALLKEEPCHPGLLTLAAVCALRQSSKDNFRNAYFHVQQAYRHAPNSAPYALNVATLAQIMGDTENAERHLRYVLENTSCAGADDLIGEGSDPFFVRWLRAVAEQKVSAAMLHAEAFIRLGEIALKKNRYEEAVRFLEQAERLDSASTRWILPMSTAYWNLGQNISAIELLQNSLCRLPMNFEVRELLCSLWSAVGAVREARALAENTLTLARACVDPPKNQ